MHVSRGGWLGQTFALAKPDDSFEAKKSGIRRSKQERKGMVETFIKRYQKSNNGDFPSLNLTRKEVGGSFYTVREIVRHIIQENRVLGPPKSPPGDQNMENLDSFLEHNPLGSISVDLHLHSDHTQTVPEHEFITENVMKTKTVNEGNIDNDNIVNVKNEAFEKLKNTELLIEGDMMEQKDEMVGNVEVGTPVATAVDEKSSEIEVLLDGDPEENNTENSKFETGNNRNLDVNGSTHVKVEDTLPAEENTINGVNLHSKISGNSVQHPTVDEKSANLSKSSEQTDTNSQKKTTNATFNRINLESWKAASKRSNGREAHQLVKFVKSFITAFVKFWTE